MTVPSRATVLLRLKKVGAKSMPRHRRSVSRAVVVCGLFVGALLGLTVGGSLAATIYCGGGYCAGTESADSLYGTNGYDNIVGKSGRDFITGYNTGDTLHGGADGDDVRGWGGNDTLYCEAGNENPGATGGRCSGFDNGDTAFGGLGEDLVDGGNGTDSLWGKEDNDVVKAEDGYADVVGGDGGYDVCYIDGYDTAYNCEAVY